MARSQNVKVEKKPAGVTADEAEILSAAAGKLAPNNSQQDSSLPNVSDDLLIKALNDRRFVQRQLKCATGEGPCDPIGRKIKGNDNINVDNSTRVRLKSEDQVKENI